MNDSKNLEQLIAAADALEAHARDARCAVAVHIRSQDAELSKYSTICFLRLLIK